MSIVAIGLASLSNVFSDSSIVEFAKAFLERTILPNNITRRIIVYYIRKAWRTGAWKALAPEARALLLASRILTHVRSSTLASLLKRIFIEIELHTLRGQALFTGIIIALKNFSYRISEILRDTTNVLFLGISYLNNPLIYRKIM